MGSKLYQRYGIDQDLQEEGVWSDLGDGIRIKVRRWRSNASLQARRDAEMRMLATLQEDKDFTDEQLVTIAIEHIAYGILVDWEGVDGLDGKPLVCTPEAAVKVLTDLPEFREVVSRIALDTQRFIDERYQETEKN